MRYLIAMLIVVTGCVMSLPSDTGVTADLAAETARMVVQLRNQPAPTPPKPADNKCENCDGTGKVGDGRIVATCPVCRGTGKKLKSVCTNCENP